MKALGIQQLIINGNNLIVEKLPGSRDASLFAYFCINTCSLCQSYFSPARLGKFHNQVFNISKLN